MAIKVNIPSGQKSATVSGLYQWDYGQVLEIESKDLDNMVGEVHFACSSMSEAIVVPCTFSAGIATVTIPNECLEQSSKIDAWIYEIDETHGGTVKTLTIPVTARPRPSAMRGEIPSEFSNQYTQLITEVNNAINKLEDGTVTAKEAKHAAKADALTGNASVANYALDAYKATKDGNGQDITQTYVTKNDHKIYSYAPASGAKITTDKTIELGGFPVGKTVDDIAGISMEIEVDGNVAPASVFVSSSKIGESFIDQTNHTTSNCNIVEFRLHVPVADSYGLGCVNIFAFVGLKGNKAYVWFGENSASYFYNIKEEGTPFGVEPLVRGNFSLERMYYWFA